MLFNIVLVWLLLNIRSFANLNCKVRIRIFSVRKHTLKPTDDWTMVIAISPTLVSCMTLWMSTPIIVNKHSFTKCSFCTSVIKQESNFAVTSYVFNFSVIVTWQDDPIEIPTSSAIVRQSDDDQHAPDRMIDPWYSYYELLVKGHL